MSGTMREVKIALCLVVLILLRATITTTATADPLFAASAAGSEQPLAIIVNHSNPVENFSFPDLRKIFLGRRSHWPNGRRITLVMQGPAQPERKLVLREIYNMSEKDLNNYFIQGVFTGSVLVSPKTLAAPADVVKFVFNVPGAIGYVRASDVNSSVKVLRIDFHLPDDKEYKLRLPARNSK
jgi:ABC-type phosphate transport system substrate-binding protein